MISNSKLHKYEERVSPRCKVASFQEHVCMVVWVPLFVRKQGIDHWLNLDLIENWWADRECPIHKLSWSYGNWSRDKLIWQELIVRELILWELINSCIFVATSHDILVWTNSFSQESYLQWHHGLRRKCLDYLHWMREQCSWVIGSMVSSRFLLLVPLMLVP